MRLIGKVPANNHLNVIRKTADLILAFFEEHNLLPVETGRKFKDL